MIFNLLLKYSSSISSLNSKKKSNKLIKINNNNASAITSFVYILPKCSYSSKKPKVKDD